jgi:hypothetical protein
MASYKRGVCNSVFAVAGILLAVCAGSASAADLTARVASVNGSVLAAAPGAGFRKIAAGSSLAAGSRIRTEAGSHAVVVLASGVAVRVSENSEVGVDQLSSEGGADAKRKIALSLSSGTVSALIDPSKRRQTDFQVATPQGVAAARGTFYAVTAGPAATYVGVRSGAVRVERGARPGA